MAFPPSQTPAAQWQWDTSNPAAPLVTGYPTPVAGKYTTTKTGLVPNDLAQFVGVPLNLGGPNGTPLDPTRVVQFLRYAEDTVETETSVLLCPTWVASPPEYTSSQATAASLPGTGQRMGVDFDVADAPYDFYLKHALDNAWLYLILRYKPIRVVAPTEQNFTSIKSLAYIYPLLNQFFSVPPQWMVEDQDFGFVRIVPATNIMMLPLFAVQLAVLGYSEIIPGAIHVQYMAGLTPSDYNNKWSFMQQYVLATAAVQILSTMQLSMNYGATQMSVEVDGLSQVTKYNPNGAFAGVIANFEKMRKDFYERAHNLVTGLSIEAI